MFVERDSLIPYGCIEQKVPSTVLLHRLGLGWGIYFDPLDDRACCTTVYSAIIRLADFVGKQLVYCERVTATSPHLLLLSNKCRPTFPSKLQRRRLAPITTGPVFPCVEPVLVGERTVFPLHLSLRIQRDRWPGIWEPRSVARKWGAKKKEQK